MKRLIFLLITPLAFCLCKAQEDDDWKLYKPVESQVKKDTLLAPVNGVVIKTIKLDFNGKDGKIQVYKDGRLDGLTSFVGTAQNGKPTVTMKGYRIQAFFDPNKDNVNQKRADYLAKYDEHPAYVDFLAPNFRLRIGDFRTKLDAEAFRDKIKDIFPDAIIVVDDIELPKLP